MTPEELKKLEKQVKKTKRLASEQAMELHDLVEDRLPAAFADIMPIAEATLAACLEWDKANKALTAAKEAEEA